MQQLSIFLAKIKLFFINLKNSIVNGFKEIFLRLSAQTPKFFNRARILFVTLGGYGATLTAAGVDFEIWHLNMAKICAIIGVLGAVFSSLAVKDGDKLKEKMDEIKTENPQ